MDIGQWHVDRTVFLVVHYRMTVEEGTATGIFTGKADWNAFIDQSGISQRFRRAPVERLIACSHLCAVTVDFRYA
ncbi:hypothetical protein D3C76_1558450 [compost metagenome]